MACKCDNSMTETYLTGIVDNHVLIKWCLQYRADSFKAINVIADT